MSRSWATLTVIFALCAFHCEIRSHELRRFSIEKILSPVSLPSRYLSVSKLHAEDDDSVYYTLCHQFEDTHHHLCNLTKLTYAFSNVVYEDVCVNIKLPATDEHFAIKVTPVAENIVVLPGLLSISESNSINVTLNFVNISSCSLNSLSLNTDQYRKFETVLYRDFFKLTVPNKDLCGDENSSAYCRISFNFKGDQIDNALPWVPTKSHRQHMLVAVDPGSTDEGNYEFDSDVIRHVDANGQRRYIAKVIEPHNGRVEVSNSRGLFAVCWLEKSRTIRCLQSDTRVLQLNRSLALSDTNFDDYTWFSVRNLAPAEILVAAGSCESTDGQYFCHEFRAWYVNKDGQKKTAMVFQDVRLVCSSGEVQAKISESTDDEYCFILRCLRKDKLLQEERWLLQSRTWCVPKDSVITPSRRAKFFV